MPDDNSTERPRQHSGDRRRDDVAERLRAVERAVTDGDTAVSDLSDAAAVHDRLDALDAELDALGERVDALDATVQSLHGYVGELEAVNDRVERRADAARAAVERFEDERRQPPGRATNRRQSDGHETGDSGVGSGPDGAEGAQPDPFDALEETDDAVDAEDDSLLDRVRESL